jgi:putative transposase
MLVLLHNTVMPRAPRDEGQDALYHIWSRGNAKQTVFHEPADYDLFIRILGMTVTRYCWLLHVFCVLPNHYHLLVETPAGNLSTGMRFLNGVFTQASNRLHDRTGHLFEGRFKSKLVLKDSYFNVLVRYIVLNPVRAFLVSNPAEWIYSSYEYTCGRSNDFRFLTTERVLSLFDGPCDPQVSYRDYVLDGLEAASLDRATLRELESNNAARNVFQSAKSETCENGMPAPGSFPDVLVNRKPVLPERVTYSRRERDDKVVELFMTQRFTLRELAEHFGIHYSTVSRIISRRLGEDHRR